MRQPCRLRSDFGLLEINVQFRRKLKSDCSRLQVPIRCWNVGSLTKGRLLRSPNEPSVRPECSSARYLMVDRPFAPGQPTRYPTEAWVLRALQRDLVDLLSTPDDSRDVDRFRCHKIEDDIAAETVHQFSTKSFSFWTPCWDDTAGLRELTQQFNSSLD